MTAALDWKFIREFHPLPNSDRRVLLKAVGVDGVKIFDDEQFYGWLTGYYRDGRAGEIDAQIQRKLSKADERGLIPMLYAWLLGCTGRQRRRERDRLEVIRSMAAVVIAKGGENAVRLRALLPNYPSVVLADFDEEAPPSAEFADEVESGWSPASKAHELDQQSTAFDEASQIEPGEKQPSAVPEAHEINEPSAVLDDEEIERVLGRTAAALEKLRERPDPTLLQWAAAFADAVDTHVSQSVLSEIEAAQLDQRRDRLAIQLAALDAVVSSRVGSLAIDHLSLAAVERVETDLLAYDEAYRASIAAREDMVASLDTTPLERDRALAAYNQSTAARDRSIETLGEGIAEAKAEAERASTEGPATERRDSAPQEKASPAKDYDPLHEQASEGPDTDLSRVSETPVSQSDEDLREADLPIEDVDYDETEDAVAAVAADAYAVDPSNAPTLATAAGSEDGPDAPDVPLAAMPAWDGWIETALRAGRFGLAVHLADGRDIAGAVRDGSLPRAAIEGLLAGNAVQAVYSRGWAAYDELRDALCEPVGLFETKVANDLLLFAGAIRPAIVQSQTALAVIQSLEGEIAAQLQPLRSVLESFADLRIDNLAHLAAPPELAAKQARVADLKRQIQEWQQTAPNRRMNYQPATAVWLELIGDGPLGQAATLIMGDVADATDQVVAILGELDNDSDHAVDVARARLSKGIRREPIEGNARRHLNGQIMAAIELFGDWVEAQRQLLKPKQDRLRGSRVLLLGAIAEAGQRVAAIDMDDESFRTASEVFQAILTDITAQLSGGIGARLHADETLDWQICLLPEFPLNSRVGFRVTAEDVAELADAAEMGFSPDLASPAKAFERALELDATSSARRLVAHLEPQRRPDATEAVESTIASARKRLVDRVRSLRQLLDDIQIATTEQSSDLDYLERAMTSFEQQAIAELPRDIGDSQTVADFPVAHRLLDRIQDSLDKARAPVRAALVARIEALEERHRTALVDCRAQLDCGDLGTLSEEIEQIEKHGPTGSPSPTALALLRRFSCVLADFGDRPSIDWGNLPRLVRDGGQCGQLDFKDLTPFDRERAGDLVRTFVELRRAFSVPLRKSDKQQDPEGRVAKETVKLLETLGWADVKLQNGKREASWYQFSMSSLALSDRDACPVPVFGSERLRTTDRRAHYALIVVDPTGADACVTALDSLPDKALLIFTDVLDHRLRRDILRRTRKGTRSVAVADGVTIATLAATTERRLRHFFELAIPMGGAHPYADTGAETAIENFFGRQREINSLVDPNGPSFVYGGRQLGKTALLKQIELRENSNQDRVAVYCYIKAVGESEGANALWEEILNQLKARKVQLPARGADRGTDIAERLKAWVDAKAGRFLLIMLDEADAFLASEMEQNFPEIGKMKQLMEATKRSIKFVFAGLHNVQRFYRAPNSPLLHWGAPINVGPLLGSDRSAARQMALEPMGALGFAFERTIDAYHMLSLVGFYPSLMQSFGKAVVGAMNVRLATRGEPSKLPMKITRSIIENCFEDTTFRDSVIYRFQETLKLDERYELITYAVWDRMQDDSRGGRTTTFGYSASDISRSSRAWWPAGFAETESLESFTAILDEMVEMGVLARKNDHYALRSQRIAAMLGSRREVGNRLQNLIERAPRRRPDPMLSHRRLASGWSPLTLRQEAALHSMLSTSGGPRIILISAAEASGLTKLRDAITALLMGPTVNWRSPRQLRSSNPQHIIDAAAILRSDAAPDAPGVVLVEGEWPDADALRGLRKHPALRESLRPVRLVLCGEPRNSVLTALSDMPDIVHVQVGPLPVEAMLHWMNREQIGFADNESAQLRLRQASGGYLNVLEDAQLDAPAKRTPELLIAAVEAAAAKVGPSQIGLGAELEAFARNLLQTIGSEPVSAPEVELWAIELGGDAGADHLRQMMALGAIETASTVGDVQHLKFNPLTARLLL